MNDGPMLVTEDQVRSAVLVGVGSPGNVVPTTPQLDEVVRLLRQGSRETFDRLRSVVLDELPDLDDRRDPVILDSHADHPLAGQVQAVLDEEGVEGVADAIRRVARGEAGPTKSVAPSATLLAVEIAARNLFRAICHEHDERGETFPVRVSLCMNALREALGEEYPPGPSATAWAET